MTLKLEKRIDALAVVVGKSSEGIERNSAAISKLTELMSKGFAAVAEDMDELRSELKYDIAAVDTKVGGLDRKVAILDQKLDALAREIASIRRDLDRLADKVDGMSGYAKEIDHALERIAAIEAHLGIARKIAA